MKKELNELVLVSCAVSIVGSIYLFVTGKKDLGIFVGLWAPTILGLGSFLNATELGEPPLPAITEA